jgi:hypothetical protein
MAQLQSTSFTGSLVVGNTENVTSAGNVWYDYTINKLKFTISNPVGGTWVAGGNTPTGTHQSGQAGESSNAMLSFSGYRAPAITFSVCNIGYNGSSWSTLGSLIYCKRTASSGGSVTSAFNAAGLCVNTPSATAETYNGISWTVAGSLITGRILLTGGAGKSSSTALVAAGQAPANSTCVEAYNGVSWSAKTGLINPTCQPLSVAGTQNSAILSGGNTRTTQTEMYNGVSWATGGTLISGGEGSAGAASNNSSAIVMNVNPTNVISQAYNGTSWITNKAMSTTRNSYSQGGGNESSAISFGGGPGGLLTATEMYTGPGITLCCL